IKDVMAEAKGRGYDPKAIRKILSIRKKKKEEYQEEEAILEVYMQALGMI
ncbi:MAG TPA: GapR family DNA-binding domain-containing protein, partial [Sphingomonas sp.]